jgi:hypothetical protein
MEVLQNAQYNLCEAKMPFQIELGKQQLTDAMDQLESGFNIDDEFIEGE